MKQMTFADAEYADKRKQTRKELFLIEMDQVVPWKGLIALIEPHYPKGEGGRPAYPLLAMLRVHLMQNWFGYSDPAMEEALYETTILRQFAGLSLERIPDETTTLNFRRLLEKHELAAGILAVINGYLGDRGLSLRQGTIVDATLIHAPSSTKNKDGKRDPEMHQTKKGNQYYFGAKAHIGADEESGSCRIRPSSSSLMSRTWRSTLYGPAIACSACTASWLLFASCKSKNLRRAWTMPPIKVMPCSCSQQSRRRPACHSTDQVIACLLTGTAGAEVVHHGLQIGKGRGAVGPDVSPMGFLLAPGRAFAPLFHHGSRGDGKALHPP